VKIIINYDLLSKIQEAKTGFSIQKTIKPILIKTGLSFAIFLPIASVVSSSPEEMLKGLSRALCIFLSSQIFISGSVDLLLSRFTKNMSKKSLMYLSAHLKEINVNTDSELILDSYKYKTEYEINKDDESKDLVQKKYIMVPIIENGEESEISIVQEHVIGSKLYFLSLGEPKKQKVFKLALNPM